ncbi:MAG: efflux RND transporter periplasmic adaptor subunit [Pseudobdellovibrionaceae bacterium]
MNSNKNKKSKWALGSVLLILFILAGWFWKARRVPSPIYTEYSVKKGDLQISNLSTGTVQPENRLEIKASVAGRIDQVLVAEGQRVGKGQILAWMSSTERAALLDAARARGADEVLRWQELYKPTPVIAPLPGTIILRNVEPGQTITAADTVFAMSDRLTVKAVVDETDIAKIKLKQKAEIILDAYPEQKISAIVDHIAFEAKPSNNVTTYLVDVLPEKVPDFLRSGMTANVRFLQETKENILLLSSEAIQLDQGLWKVQTRNADKKIEYKQIKVGISDGKSTEIVSGLSEGDTVVREQVNTQEKSSSNNPFSPFGNRKLGQSKSSSGRH